MTGVLLLLRKSVDHVGRKVDQRNARVAFPTVKDNAVKPVITMPVVAKGWIPALANGFTL